MTESQYRLILEALVEAWLKKEKEMKTCEN